MVRKKLFLIFALCLLLVGVTACAGDEQAPAGDSEAVEAVEETETADAQQAEIQQMVEEMSLYEKVCQMLIVNPERLYGAWPVTSVDEGTHEALDALPVGGIMYCAENFVDKTQTQTMLSTLQSYSKIPLFLSIDEEGGRVNRLMGSLGTTRIGPMLDYADQGTDVAYQNAYTIGYDMYALGLNLNLAPVADVWSNPQNTVIGDRAYSTDFNQAAELIPAAVYGFHDGGVATAVKHFPGHGDTLADSHKGMAYVTKTLDELRAQEFLPFEAGIKAGTDMVMLGHLVVESIDSEPTPFSYTIVTEILREELGFDGVIITDGLLMEAVVDSHTSSEIALKAVSAGCDMLLCPDNPKEAADALQEAVTDGTLSEARIDESVARILTVKVERGILALDDAQ